MNAERIHINEAVRTYNKTRQTFYNWIKKWYLHEKKVNNKIYIATEDIEHLLSDYIWEPPHEIDNTQQEHTYQPQQLQHHDDDPMVYDLMVELQQQKHLLTQKVDEQKIWFVHELHLTKQELRTDIQRVAEGLQQQQYISTEEAKKQFSSTQWHLDSLTKRLFLTNKRTTFWVWLLLFILVNSIILTLWA